MRKTFVKSVLAASVFLLLGCSHTDSFTALSSKNVNVNSIKVDKTKLKAHSTGQDCKYIVFFVPTGVPQVKEAIDKALESGLGNILLNARIEDSFFSIGMFGKMCYTVEGDVYETY